MLLKCIYRNPHGVEQGGTLHGHYLAVYYRVAVYHHLANSRRNAVANSLAANPVLQKHLQQFQSI